MVTSKQPDAGCVLFGATRRAVLGLLFDKPDEPLHLRQIARLTGAGLGPVQRELAALVNGGILQREVSGRQVYFQANPSCPIFAELRALIQKVSGAAAILRRALQPFEPRIRAALIFGSVASGAQNRRSDLDLLIISDQLHLRDLASSLRAASTLLGRDVNLNLHTPLEWAVRVAENHPLARSILESRRVMVVGDEGELARLAAERMDQAASVRRGGDSASLRRRRARSPRRKR